MIWTMRRTGGTTLASLLGTLSEYRGVQHEPFNNERIYGHISAAFVQTADATQLRLDLWELLAKRPLIKHCYELVSHAFNEVLLEVTAELSYRHIILDRRNEIDRIVSLELAYQTGAWGGDAAKKIYPAIEAGEVVLEPLNLERARQQISLCHTHRQELAQKMDVAQIMPFVVYFEDVYSRPQAGRALIERLLAFLDIRPEDHADYEKQVSDALLRRGQNSAQILQAVPDVDAAIKTLKALHSGRPPVFEAS